MKFLSVALFTFNLYLLAKAGDGKLGSSCSQGNNRLQIGTFQFWGDCDAQTYCASNGKCTARGCRRDDFPFGYAEEPSKIPPKCARGWFCPDEEDACQPLLKINDPCQLNRDDQCEAPPNFRELADTTGRGQNYNGSVCLNNQCMWANATLGQPCVVENTPYIAYEPTGEFINIVSRGNCRIGLYCDAQQRVCLKNKPIGAACTADKECDTWNCQASGFCGQDAAIPHHFGLWVYIIVALGIFGGMFGTLTGLFIAHRKQREEEREKRVQYWREQNAFHQNLLQMRETARNSILSATSAKRTPFKDTVSDEAHAPILNAPRASGLRNYVADDNSSEYDEGIMMQSGHKPDGRF